VLTGQHLDDATVEAAANAGVAGAQPLSENGYKVELLKILLRRTLKSLA
jgi:CO/xanthine dehydrogenase FAD-binding subunit